MVLFAVPIVGALGGIMGQMAASLARVLSYNGLILAVSIVAIGAALNLLITTIAGYTSTLLTQTSTVPFVPYYLPSNLGYCLSAYLAVKFAGTTYVLYNRFIERKSYIMKA